MNDKCIEIGTIQAFLDGETTPELSFEITTHAAACDKCALMIAEAEEESAQVFAVLDRELNTLVPTQRLWSSITVALAEEKKQQSFWQKARVLVLSSFASPSFATAASIVVVVGLLAAVWSVNTPDNSTGGPEMAASGNPQPAPATAVNEVNIAAHGAEEVTMPPAGRAVEVKETNYSADRIGKLAVKAVHRAEPVAARAEPAVVYLPGEESYIRTIASLKEDVDARKDLILDPRTRISFERDLAVVNDSIKRMKEVVRKNPRDQAAKQVLYSSYQNKIDLLNSVVEREELLASIQ
jgi:ribosomal protein S15P/S13E